MTYNELRNVELWLRCCGTAISRLLSLSAHASPHVLSCRRRSMQCDKSLFTCLQFPCEWTSLVVLALIGSTKPPPSPSHQRQQHDTHTHTWSLLLRQVLPFRLNAIVAQHNFCLFLRRLCLDLIRLWALSIVCWCVWVCNGRHFILFFVISFYVVN